MPIREFTDPAGVAWRVWDTLPDRTDVLSPEYRTGWLTFDSGSERRRLAPMPAGWAGMPSDRLALLVRVAEPSPGATAVTPSTAHPAAGPPDDAASMIERRRGERRRGDRRRSSTTTGPMASEALALPPEEARV